jgi:hypothetical protein
MLARTMLGVDYTLSSKSGENKERKSNIYKTKKVSMPALLSKL